MPFEMQKVNTSPAKENDLDSLIEELHLLEIETFEIEDFAYLSQNPAMAMVKPACSCGSPGCSCTSTSACAS